MWFCAAQHTGEARGLRTEVKLGLPPLQKPPSALIWPQVHQRPSSQHLQSVCAVPGLLVASVKVQVSVHPIAAHCCSLCSCAHSDSSTWHALSQSLTGRSYPFTPTVFTPGLCPDLGSVNTCERCGRTHREVGLVQDSDEIRSGPPSDSACGAEQEEVGVCSHCSAPPLIFGGFAPAPSLSCLVYCRQRSSLNGTGKEFCFHVVGKQRPTQISTQFYGQAGELVNLLRSALIPTARWEQGL